MKSRLSLLVLAFFAIVSRGICHDDDDVDYTDVTTLTTSSFDDFVESAKQSLVVFYAPWCGHCKQLMPEFAAAATQLKGQGISLGKVDATIEKDLGSRFGVKGFPTLKYFAKSQTPVEYSGGRTTDLIVKWMENMGRPSLPVVAESEIDFSGAVTFVVRVKADKSKPFNMCNKLADALKLSYRFFAVVDSSNKDEITVYRTGETPITIAIGSDYDVLDKWASEEKFPLFGQIDADTYAAYEGRDAEITWFAGLREDFEKHAPEMRKAAAVYRKTHSFVWVDSNTFGSYVEGSLGMTVLPGLARRLKDNSLYMYPQEDMKNLTSEKIIKFFKDVDAGKIEKYIKSEPIPETNDDPVKIVVAKNFDQMVFHKNKDVLLEIYAPWCGFCKRLEPIYNSAAEKLLPYDHIIFAKMDGTANEAVNPKFSFKSFPTLYFVKAGSDSPIPFGDDRTEAGFLNFIKEHSSQPVDIEVVPEVETSEEKDEL